MNKQHMIDLLPEAIRTRSEAGMVIGRYITVGAVVVVALVILSTHAHFQNERAETALEVAEAKSRQVLAVEAQAARLHERQNRLNALIAQYEKVAPPLLMSDVQSLVVSQLPPSIALERIHLDVVQEAQTFDPRIKDTKNQTQSKRVLRAELTGFARTDADVSELVNRLESLSPLTSVSIDYSKSRELRAQPAREFCLSLRIDLDRKFIITRRSTDGEDASKIASGEADHVE